MTARNILETSWPTIGTTSRIVDIKAEYRFAHGVVSEIKGGIAVKFIFVKKEASYKDALALMTTARDMGTDEVIISYMRP